ncbi:hypothetical protein RF11_12359 [Thelohanellus kitauei]|uniref:Uncharacterized protein n=1 Tax=Thelohanellus kitauei TaxID=669202 RepID=A0A0C2NFU5_THEKT|nr:hypothetical protein RF11_12359 [Thelohanellus kitauei]
MNTYLWWCSRWQGIYRSFIIDKTICRYPRLIEGLVQVMFEDYDYVPIHRYALVAFASYGPELDVYFILYALLTDSEGTNIYSSPFDNFIYNMKRIFNIKLPKIDNDRLIEVIPEILCTRSYEVYIFLDPANSENY